MVFCPIVPRFSKSSPYYINKIFTCRSKRHFLQWIIHFASGIITRANRTTVKNKRIIWHGFYCNKYIVSIKTGSGHISTISSIE